MKFISSSTVVTSRKCVKDSLKSCHFETVGKQVSPSLYVIEPQVHQEVCDGVRKDVSMHARNCCISKGILGVVWEGVVILGEIL